MSRFIRIVIFTLLIATIVFFGFRALLSTNTLQATKNNQPNNESNPETVEASESETQTNEINNDPSDNKDSSADKSGHNKDNADNDSN